jgi:hypothetical protein
LAFRRQTPARVGPVTSTLWWINCPLWITLTNRAFSVFLPLLSKRGARNVTMNFCHSPGGLLALMIGAAPPKPLPLAQRW